LSCVVLEIQKYRHTVVVLAQFKSTWGSSAVQKIKKLSETTGTVPIVAELCMIDCKNTKIAEKFVQPVTPHLGCF